MTELERARSFVRALPLALAEQVLPSRFGYAVFVRSLPLVYWINLVSVDPGTRATANELADEAERVQGPAGLRHRKVGIYDDLGYDASRPTAKTTRSRASSSTPSTGAGGAVGVRYFAARADGEIASYCELFSDGETAQVESVMTLERFRGRGLAKAVVSHAVREARAAGHSLVFLVAEDDDWPKELYARLGFERRGHAWEIIREPGSG